MLAVPALAIEENATVYTGVTTTVVDSEYLDINIWYFITALGIGLMILSNRVKSEPENALYAWMAIPFMLISARYSIMLQSTDIHSIIDAVGIHVQVVKVIQHPEWVGVLMGIIFLLSFINALYISTKKPIERPNPMMGNEEK
jgi:bacteriorhodopsin